MDLEGQVQTAHQQAAAVAVSYRAGAREALEDLLGAGEEVATRGPDDVAIEEGVFCPRVHQGIQIELGTAQEEADRQHRSRGAASERTVGVNLGKVQERQ